MGGTAPGSLRVLCVSRDGSAAAGVAAMLASVPDFVIATRTASYRDVLRGARNLDLAIVLLDDEPSAGLDVIETLRRGKDDVKEVKSGFECGIKLANYDDIKIGDRLEAYIRETFERTL